jgi:hypothetical protein
VLWHLNISYTKSEKKKKNIDESRPMRAFYFENGDFQPNPP